MPTPTSPAPSPSEDEVLGDALAAFRAGNVRTSGVKGLSDLSRGGRDALVAAWPDLPEAVRRKLTRQMGRLAQDRVELNFGRALRVALDDESAKVRKLAVEGLWEDEASDLQQRLTEMATDDPSLEVRAEALRGLHRFARKAAEDELDAEEAQALRSRLIDAAGDPTQPGLLRRLALEALGAFGDDDVSAMIDAAHDSSDPAMQRSATVAMGRSMDAAWLPTLFKDLVGGDAEMREAAARSIGQIGEPSAVPELASACRDAVPGVRQAAIEALGQIGGRAAINALHQLEGTAAAADRATIEASLLETQGDALPI